jgi:hypothetical protein
VLKSEQELVINIWSMNGTASVYASWPRWRRRILACEEVVVPMNHKEIVEAQMPAKMIWLRRHLGSAQKAAFPEQRDLLLAAQNNEVIYRTTTGNIMANERETTLHAELVTPYWLFIGTDLKNWQERLSKHPYFVLLEEMQYANGDDVWSYGAIPLSLLSIRKKRHQGRQLTDDERQALRDRLAKLRDKAKK